MRQTAEPAWLRARVNDPYGTPERNPFWLTVDFERVGAWKIFQDDGGVWRAYDTRWNGWWHFASRDEAVARAEGNPKGLDLWP